MTLFTLTYVKHQYDGAKARFFTFATIATDSDEAQKKVEAAYCLDALELISTTEAPSTQVLIVRDTDWN